MSNTVLLAAVLSCQFEKRSFLFKLKIAFVLSIDILWVKMRAPLAYGIPFLPDSIGQSKWIVYFSVVSGQLMIAEKNLYGHFLVLCQYYCLHFNRLIIYFGEKKKIINPRLIHYSCLFVGNLYCMFAAPQNFQQ